MKKRYMRMRGTPVVKVGSGEFSDLLLEHSGARVVIEMDDWDLRYLLRQVVAQIKARGQVHAERCQQMTAAIDGVKS